MRHRRHFYRHLQCVVSEFLTGLILLMVFALNLKWFPVGGWGSGFWDVFALPGLFTRYDPIAQDMTALLQSPSAHHFFGTDNLGRDVFARVVYGARVDLLIGIFAMLVPAVIGTLIGLLAGYYGGKIDALVMRILDLFTAFPLMVMVIAIVPFSVRELRTGLSRSG